MGLCSQVWHAFFSFSYMKKHKTDESVKAGLQLEADTNPLKKNRAAHSGYDDAEEERDADEMAHEPEFEPTAEFNKQDQDDLVHRMPATKTVRDEDEADPDDLVHGK